MPVTRITIDADIPEGYEYVKFALPETGDFYLKGLNTVGEARFDWAFEPQLILKKVPVWRDATVEDVNPYNPKECRVKNEGDSDWSPRHLIAVCRDRFFTVNTHNLAGSFTQCQVKK